MKRVIISAGGTGGHLFPAISAAEELDIRGYDVHLITDLRGYKYLNDDIRFKVHIVDIYISNSNLLAFIKSMIRLGLAVLKSIKLVYQINPSITIGFGGYQTFAPVFASLVLFKPIVIHEQNSFIGKSNRFFSKFAKKIALSYKETVNICDKYKEQVIVTGDIVRSNIKNLPPKKTFKSQVFHILIFGGSQGAKIFSTLIPESIKLLITNHPNIHIHITQQVSKADQEEVKKIYNSLGVDSEISEFFHDMDKKYDRSQLVISRSGATTIAELTYIGLPAIFIPYIYAAENHQLYNAKNVEKIGASWCFEQNKVTPFELSEKIFELINDRKLLEIASSSLLTRKSDGVKVLSDTIEKIIG